METSYTVFGGNSVGVTPVLIPNTEVKSYSADDTALETMWESRSPPNFFEGASIFFEEKMEALFLKKTEKVIDELGSF